MLFTGRTRGSAAGDVTEVGSAMILAGAPFDEEAGLASDPGAALRKELCDRTAWCLLPPPADRSVGHHCRSLAAAACRCTARIGIRFRSSCDEARSDPDSVSQTAWVPGAYGIVAERQPQRADWCTVRVGRPREQAAGRSPRRFPGRARVSRRLAATGSAVAARCGRGSSPARGSARSRAFLGLLLLDRRHDDVVVAQPRRRSCRLVSSRCASERHAGDSTPA